jgi:uncharacterized delta-60 repeat protein
VAVTVLATLAPTQAQAITGGAVDARFGSCGQATVLIPRAVAGRQFSYGAGSSLAVQPDGKVIAAGPAARGMGATRFNADGSIDTTFGDGGVAFIAADVPRSDETQVTAVALQPDGKVLAAGWLRTQGPGDDPGLSLVERFVIARFTAAGQPDPSFGGDGIVIEAPAGSSSASIHGIAPLPGGGLVVAGQVDDRFAVGRYRDDGTLDPGFGEAGVARVTTGTRQRGRGHAVAVQPDGRVLAAGDTNADGNSRTWTLARLTASGAPDASFGGTGTVTETLDESSTASTLVPLADGRFYAVGTTVDFWGNDEGGGTTRRAATIRYLPNGARDTAFAGDGSVLDALGQGLYSAVSPTGAALDANGRLTLATQYGPLVRYTEAGARDLAFGTEGILRVFSAPSGMSIAARPDGSLFLGGVNSRQGSRPTGFEWGAAIMRLAGSGQALESLKGQPAACAFRVRNTSIRHLLRRSRTARYGRVLVGAFLPQPTPGGGQVVARATAGGRTFELGSHSFATNYAGSSSFEVPIRKASYARLARARSVRIELTLTLADRDTTAATAARTLSR